MTHLQVLAFLFMSVSSIEEHWSYPLVVIALFGAHSLSLHYKLRVMFSQIMITVHSASGSQFMVNSDGSHGNSLKFGLEETADDDLDEYPQRPGKKRRLTADQVEFLEKNFEVENKLEPERKLQLAKDLGLKPRQVAIWFQNRRARWKAKQLEKGYESLKSSYDSLKLDHDNLLKENEKLQAEVIHPSKQVFFFAVGCHDQRMKSTHCVCSY